MEEIELQQLSGYLITHSDCEGKLFHFLITKSVMVHIAIAMATRFQSCGRSDVDH